MGIFKSPFSTFFESRGDNWFYTSRARGLFFVSTLFVIGLTPIFWIKSLPQLDTWLNVLVGLFGVVAVVAVYYLYWGMWHYWGRLDDSSKWIKRFWFVALLIGFWWGSILYCYCLYLPQTSGNPRQGASSDAPIRSDYDFGLGGKILVVGWVALFVWVAGLFLLPRVFNRVPNSGITLISLVLILSSVGYLISRKYKQGMRRSRTR